MFQNMKSPQILLIPRKMPQIQKKIGYFYMEKNLQHMILFYVSPLHRKKLQTKCGMMVPNSLKKKKAPHQTKNYVVIHGPETQKKKKSQTHKNGLFMCSHLIEKKKSLKTKKILWYVMISSLKKKSQTQKKIWCEVFIVVPY